MSKTNCWEHFQCGREPGGKHASEHGICPAALDSRLDGVHGGSRSGRSCWVISGTLCKGNSQSSFASKFSDCRKCEFYRQVQDEEYPRFHLAPYLLKQLEQVAN